MKGFVKVESVAPAEFEKLDTIMVEINKGEKYILTKSSIFYPRSTIKVKHIAVNIVKCRVGNKLKFKIFSQEGGFLCQHISEKILILKM